MIEIAAPKCFPGHLPPLPLMAEVDLGIPPVAILTALLSVGATVVYIIISSLTRERQQAAPPPPPPPAPQQPIQPSTAVLAVEIRLPDGTSRFIDAYSSTTVQQLKQQVIGRRAWC